MRLESKGGICFWGSTWQFFFHKQQGKSICSCNVTWLLLSQQSKGDKRWQRGDLACWSSIWVVVISPVLSTCGVYYGVYYTCGCSASPYLNACWFTSYSGGHFRGGYRLKYSHSKTFSLWQVTSSASSDIQMWVPLLVVDISDCGTGTIYDNCSSTGVSLAEAFYM